MYVKLAQYCTYSWLNCRPTPAYNSCRQHVCSCRHTLFTVHVEQRLQPKPEGNSSNTTMTTASLFNNITPCPWCMIAVPTPCVQYICLPNSFNYHVRGSLPYCATQATLNATDFKGVPWQVCPGSTQAGLPTQRFTAALDDLHTLQHQHSTRSAKLLNTLQRKPKHQQTPMCQQSRLLC